LAVLWQAVKDLRGLGSPSPEEHLDAVVFLASRKATLWWDVAKIEQGAALLAMGWQAHARKLVEDPEVSLTPAQAEIVKRGLGVFAGLKVGGGKGF
jgi:hypothetical protein